jgi:hypothetical protein
MHIRLHGAPRPAVCKELEAYVSLRTALYGMVEGLQPLLLIPRSTQIASFTDFNI